MVCVSPFTRVSQFIKFLFVKCNYLYITLSLVVVHTVHTVILQYMLSLGHVLPVCVCLHICTYITPSWYITLSIFVDWCKSRGPLLLVCILHHRSLLTFQFLHSFHTVIYILYLLLCWYWSSAPQHPGSTPGVSVQSQRPSSRTCINNLHQGLFILLTDKSSNQ